MSTESTSSDVLLIDILVPARLVTESNNDRHWRRRAKRAKAHRTAAMLICRTATSWQVPNPNRRYRVLITRIAPRKLDTDNAVSSAKHIRDGIADAMGIDDRSDLIAWEVDQERGEPNTYAARVRIWEVRNG